MANFDLFINRLLRIEGGYVKHPNDQGGCCCKGITLPVYRGEYGAGLTCEDLKTITDEQAGKIYKKYYWDVCMADKIADSNIAYLLVDFAVNSGCKKAIKAIQELVGVEVDGYMGKITLTAINSYYNPKELFDMLMEYRVDFYNRIVVNKPSQNVFLRGWLNRLKEWEYKE